MGNPGKQDFEKPPAIEIKVNRNGTLAICLILMMEG
jgi:hypothetical protein